MAIHVSYSLSYDELPLECINDCSGSGDVTEAVVFWTERLGFTVERGPAIQCLSGYGVWEDEELTSASDEWLAQRILWIACCDFHEFLLWESKHPDSRFGTDLFVLE